MDSLMNLPKHIGKRFNKLEMIISEGQKHFIEVGTALLIIRDEKLYRKCLGFKTFEEYCKSRWGYARRTAYQFIDSAKMIENVRHGAQIETLPTSERQARPLTHLEPDQQKEVWEEAVRTAPEGKITAKHVESVVAEVIHKRRRHPPDPNIKRELISEKFETAVDNLYSAIKSEKMMKWKYTAKEVALRHVESLRDVILI